VLTIVDVASRYKEAGPLTSKDSAEVAKAFQSIYKRSPLTWDQLLQVDPGREFMGSVTKEMENHRTAIRRGHPEIQRSIAWVKRRPDVVAALNGKVTSLIGKKPTVTIIGGPDVEYD